MRGAILKLADVTGLVARLGLWLAGIGLVLMTAAVFAQVFYRYIIGYSLFWAEPASVMLMGWFIFIGAAVGVKEGYHLSFDVGLMVVPEGWRPCPGTPRLGRLLTAVRRVSVLRADRAMWNKSGMPNDVRIIETTQ